MSAAVYDVTFVGGGLVGLAGALLIKNAAPENTRIAVIEAGKAPAAPTDEVGLRVSALSMASAKLLEHCGVWDALGDYRLETYSGMCVWQEDFEYDTERALNFSAAELGRAGLGYIAENDVLRYLLWQAVEAAGIDVICARPAELSVGEDAVAIEFEGADSVATRLLVGADGANSWVRRSLEIETRGDNYGQKAIVGNISSEHPHQDTAWQRFLAGGPVALLPLPDGRCSIVWSCQSDEADRLLELDDEAFAAELTAATDGVLGQLRCTTPRAAFPLSHAHAVAYSGKRFALIGDAAHRIHPLAGQGVNLGLLDAAALAETVGAHLDIKFADPGDALMLARFERWRRRDNDQTLAMMNALHSLFAGGTGDTASAVAHAGGLGLAAVNAVTPLKRIFAEHAMGIAGDLPAAARQ